MPSPCVVGLSASGVALMSYEDGGPSNINTNTKFSTIPVTVTVVIVTYNPRALLSQTLKAIQSQSYPIEAIIVVDNCSTDGTQDMLRQVNDASIIPLFMTSNLGGAGGFSAGIERAYRLGTDFVWVMDDDVLPEVDALRRLVEALN